MPTSPTTNVIEHMRRAVLRDGAELGDGELLQLLESCGIDGRGIELSREGVNRCVAKGLAVVQGDADLEKLIGLPDSAFSPPTLPPASIGRRTNYPSPPHPVKRTAAPNIVSVVNLVRVALSRRAETWVKC
ncbi:hypothetical protein B4Q13_24625, partial [Lacticaseibacillus rhamnosus]